MSVPLAMLDAHLRRFPLRRRDIHVAGGSLRLVAPESGRAVLGRADLAGPRGPDGELRLPHWADIWPAGVGAARWLMRGPSLRGVRVLDLGCGVGVAGTAAGARGAEVLFVDREADALRFAAFNATANGVERHTALQLDWLRDTVPAGVDLLLLCDVGYEYRNLGPLLRQVRRVVGAGGSALFADPYRDSANDFVAWLGREFALEVTDTSTHFDGVRVPLRMCWVSARSPCPSC